MCDIVVHDRDEVFFSWVYFIYLCFFFFFFFSIYVKIRFISILSNGHLETELREISISIASSNGNRSEMDEDILFMGLKMARIVIKVNERISLRPNFLREYSSYFLR